MIFEVENRHCCRPTGRFSDLPCFSILNRSQPSNVQKRWIQRLWKSKRRGYNFRVLGFPKFGRKKDKTWGRKQKVLDSYEKGQEKKGEKSIDGRIVWGRPSRHPSISYFLLHHHHLFHLPSLKANTSGVQENSRSEGCDHYHHCIVSPQISSSSFQILFLLL